MQKKIVNIVKHCKLAFVVLLVALIGIQTLDAGALVMAQAGATVPGAELESSAEAKRGLAGIDSRVFAKVKDAKERRALQRSYDALKAIADNTSRAREAALIASFDRSIKDLKGLPPPKAVSFEACDRNFDFCIKNCTSNASCKLCQISNGDCYLVQWAAHYAHEEVP